MRNRFSARVDAVTAADARRVIKQHFPLENLVFTLIAKASEIAPLAKKYATDIQTESRRWPRSTPPTSRQNRALGQAHGKAG